MNENPKSELALALKNLAYRERHIYRKVGELYLSRYYLSREENGTASFLHRFNQSDFPYFHNHPWDFIAMPLENYYLEHLQNGEVLERQPGEAIFRTSNEFHYITLPNGPVWTLFIHFPRSQDWGFLTPEGFVQHEEYNRSLGLEEYN